MGHYKDIAPSANQGWIHELARAEVHPDAERLLNLNAANDPSQLIEESTVDFLTELREDFTEFTRVFNGYSETGKIFQEAKIFSVAQTASDFMIFRNQVKLVFSNNAHGSIHVSFSQHTAGAVSVNGQTTQGQEFGQPQDLMAQVGPFRNIFWTFHGEKVTPDQVARFYFPEFIRASRDLRRSKAGNQLLLEQIKALLQEKGIQL